MGLVLLLFTYLIVAAVLFFVGPVLYFWVTTKIVKFKDPSFKQYVLFWVIWLLSFSVVNWLMLFIGGQFSQSEDVKQAVLAAVNESLLLTPLIQTVLAMLIFKEPFVQALKATVVYSILFAVSFVVVAIVALQLGLSLLTN